MICKNCQREIGTSSVCPYCHTRNTLDPMPHHLPAGTVIGGRYTILGALGEGGFGITYLGRNNRLEHTVAIKEYYPHGVAHRSNSSGNEVYLGSDVIAESYNHGKERFLKEAKTLAKFINEPGIVNVTDFVEENNTAYLIMEYLDGITLKEYLKKHGRLDPVEAFKMLMPTINALEKIHAVGIIHRDISPDNIMILRNGQPKLMDFGSARVYLETISTMSIMLKKGYAPEEQYHRNGEQGPWTDVYGLCATVYHCITGETPDESLDRLTKDRLKEPSELGVPISDELESTLMYGLAVYKKDRCENMTELKRLLEYAFQFPYVPREVKEAAGKPDGGQAEGAEANKKLPVTKIAPPKRAAEEEGPEAPADAEGASKPDIGGSDNAEDPAAADTEGSGRDDPDDNAPVSEPEELPEGPNAATDISDELLYPPEDSAEAEEQSAEPAEKPSKKRSKKHRARTESKDLTMVPPGATASYLHPKPSEDPDADPGDSAETPHTYSDNFTNMVIEEEVYPYKKGFKLRSLLILSFVTALAVVILIVMFGSKTKDIRNNSADEEQATSVQATETAAAPTETVAPTEPPVTRFTVSENTPSAATFQKTVDYMFNNYDFSYYHFPQEVQPNGYTTASDGSGFTTVFCHNNDVRYDISPTVIIEGQTVTLNQTTLSDMLSNGWKYSSGQSSPEANRDSSQLIELTMKGKNITVYIGKTGIAPTSAKIVSVFLDRSLSNLLSPADFSYMNISSKDDIHTIISEIGAPSEYDISTDSFAKGIITLKMTDINMSVSLTIKYQYDPLGNICRLRSLNLHSYN